MSREQERQLTKEKAMLIGIQRGMALFRRNTEIHGMKADGTTVLICQNEDYDKLWDETLKTLEAAK